MLALVTSLVSDDQIREGGREVTWSDFRNYMLEPGDVEKIVVTNRNTARVFLRPGARGVPARVPQGGGGPFGGRLGSSSGQNRTNVSEPWGGMDSTIMNMDSNDQMSMGTDSSPSGSGVASPLGGLDQHNQHNQLVYHFSLGSVENFERKLEDAQRELGMSTRDFVPVQYATETSWGTELFKLAPTMVIMGMIFFAMRNMGGAGGGGGGGGMGNIFKIGKSPAKKIKKEDINVNFSDVAGCDEAKREIMEFVDFLKDSERFTKLGAKIPKGALLCGPPGTGKTLLAKAVAGEASVPFFSISGSDFIEMFVGVGPSRVRDLFKEARANAPCIVFIDEIDAVGRQRGKGGFSGGNDERENTLNQLLVEMDGFSSSSGVVVLGGTNRVDILDSALTRPGRFDRQVFVDKPDLGGRQQIFEVHLKGITLEDEISDISGRLAGLTPGFTGADIANIANEAAIQAARRAGETVSMEDFEKAIDRVIGGLESGKMISKAEQKIVAHHEAGHAVAGWFLEHADPLMKVTIVPRSSGALGFAQYLPKELFLRTEQQITDIMCMALAGRAAEEVFFNRVTTGASDDLKRVTGMVYGMIQSYGMNERIGQLAFPKDQQQPGEPNPYSDATAQAMDEEAKRIVDLAYTRTLNLIREKKEDVQKVADLLISKETITHDDVVELIGDRPFDGDDNYKEFVSRKTHDKKKQEVKEDKKEEDDATTENTPLTPGLA
jgi:AFG3 family protein